MTRVSARDAAAVRSMFDRISGRYDLLNTLLSGGMDARWRRRAADAARLRTGAFALDLACGTGRLTAELANRVGPGGRAVGLDFSPAMLAVARIDHPRLMFVHGSALEVPFAGSTFDATTMAFGLRNLAAPERGLAEMARVLKPDGRAVVLEFLRPPGGVVGRAYGLYLEQVLPRIGGLVSGDRRAYAYLSETIASYHSAEELAEMAIAAGWSSARVDRMMFGTLGILSGPT